MWTDPHLSLTDAYYEAVSDITTTGSTVIVGLDRLHPGLLLWRSLLQWVGGIGIVVMAVAVLPLLKVGGMQLMNRESSRSEERRVGEECVSTCRSRWSPDHYKKKIIKDNH